MDRFPNARIGAAATDIAAHRVVDLRVVRLWIRGEESGSAHDLSRLTEPALRHAEHDPRFLAGMAAVGRQPFDRRNVRQRGHADVSYTRANCFAVEVNRAGAALRNSATE